MRKRRTGDYDKLIKIRSDISKMERQLEKDKKHLEDLKRAERTEEDRVIVGKIRSLINDGDMIEGLKHLEMLNEHDNEKTAEASLEAAIDPDGDTFSDGITAGIDDNFILDDDEII